MDEQSASPKAAGFESFEARYLRIPAGAGEGLGDQSSAVPIPPEQFRLLAENIPTLCWMANADGYIFWYNRRWYDYTGTTPAEMEGWGWRSVHDADALPAVMTRWTAAIASGEPFEMTFPLRGADGLFRPFLTRIQPMRDDADRITRWVGVNTDVSAQFAAETALRESEARSRHVLEGMAEGFVLLDHDFRVLQINAEGLRLEQRGPEEILGKTHWEAWPGSEQTPLGELYKRAMAERSAQSLEHRYQWGDGHEAWLELRVYPTPEGLAAFYRDITERKQAQARLQALNETLAQRVAEQAADRDRVWQVSQDLFLVCGYDGVYRSVNPAWTRMLGYEQSELVGMRFDALAHPDDVALTEAKFGELLGGQTVKEVEIRVLAKDGGYRLISWTCIPHEGVLYASGHDITGRQELEERLRQSQKMEAVGQLTGGVAHDFNNLLTIISGNLEILLRRMPEGDVRQRRSAENALQGAQRAATLTQRLLAFARRQPLQPRPLLANRIITGLSEMLSRTLGEEVEVQTVLSGGLWTTEADPAELESALLNLAVNARDAMPAGGKLTIETANAHLDEAYATAQAEVTPGQYIMISVSDTGTGMTREVLDRVFEPFFTTKEVGQGTGLGLSQVYGFVKQSGGHVKAYSEPGEGTSLKIYLPRLLHAAQPHETAPDLPAALGAGEETVLVVEDDHEVRAYSVEVLLDLGYRVLEAPDGPSALRLLESDESIDLLFTDVVLPGGMSGRDVADRARKQRPDLKVLYTSGYSRNAIVHQGRLDPGVQLIGKPFTYADLAARVRDLLDRLD